jgi:hypothetical protein
MQQFMMRKSRPLRWIEEAEARQVITLALSEAPPLPDSPDPARAPIPWMVRLRRWGFTPAAGAMGADEAVPDAAVRQLRR